MIEKPSQTSDPKPLSKARLARQDRARKRRERDDNVCPAIIVRQVRSAIRRPKVQSLHLRGLGLGRVGREKRLPDTLSNRGRVAKVAHLLDVRFEE